jgi:hypothetical protein
MDGGNVRCLSVVRVEVRVGFYTTNYNIRPINIYPYPYPCMAQKTTEVDPSVCREERPTSITN